MSETVFSLNLPQLFIFEENASKKRFRMSHIASLYYLHRFIFIVLHRRGLETKVRRTKRQKTGKIRFFKVHVVTTEEALMFVLIHGAVGVAVISQ